MHGEYGLNGRGLKIGHAIGFLCWQFNCLLITYFEMTTNKEGARITESTANLTFFCLLLVYSAVSICYINYHLSKNDFGAEIKKTIKWRHFINLIGWQILNSFILVSAIATKLDIDYKKGSDHKVLKIFQFIFYSQGLFLPLLRMTEPVFF